MSQQSVNLAVEETARLVAENSKNGKLVYKADTRWEGDVKLTARIRNFEPISD